jgi:hypothetical protein
MRKEFDPGKAAASRTSSPKKPLNERNQEAAAGAVEHQHRITCGSLALIGNRPDRFFS